MTAVLISRELLFATRIQDAANRAGVDLLRIDDPSGLPVAESVRVVLVDWSERRPAWGEQLAAWRVNARESWRPRILLYGPHTDLEAHAAARAARLGPMWARSKLVRELDRLMMSAG